MTTTAAKKPIAIPKRYRHDAFVADSIADFDIDTHWAIFEYGHYDFEYLNAALRMRRKLDTSEMRVHRQMRKGLIELQDSITLWRGVDVDSYVAFQRRDNWQDRAWVSTSLSRQVGARFAGVRRTSCRDENDRYLLKLNVEAGIKVLPLSAVLHVGEKKFDDMWPEHMDEREIVLPPRLRYRVTNRRIVKRSGFTPYTHLDVDVTQS